MPKLEITIPELGEVSHELLDETITLGRLSDNGIQIEHPSVSSRHGEFTLEGKNYRFKDLGSTNGTFVNGEQVEETLLKKSCAIRFGQIEGFYISDENEPTMPLPEQEEALVPIAASSRRPQSFSNASPFKASKKKKPPLVVGIYSFAGFAIAVFAAAVFMILRLQPPG